jgi:hypothetical protein
MIDLSMFNLAVWLLSRFRVAFGLKAFWLRAYQAVAESRFSLTQVLAD